MRNRIIAAAIAAVIGSGLGGAPALATQPQTTICHPVGSATGGNTHAGYSIITPANPSSHIDEETGAPKHEHDGRVDFVVTPETPCPPAGEEEPDLSISINVDVDCDGYSASVTLGVNEGHKYRVTAPGFDSGVITASETGTVTVTASGPQTSGTIHAVNHGESLPSVKVEASKSFAFDGSCESPSPTPEPEPSESPTPEPPVDNPKPPPGSARTFEHGPLPKTGLADTVGLIAACLALAAIGLGSVWLSRREEG